MSYRLLALPPGEVAPALSGCGPGRRRRSVRHRSGGRVSAGFPAYDRPVERLAAELWGDCDGSGPERTVSGTGKAIPGPEAEGVLAEMGVRPDFECKWFAGESAIFIADGAMRTFTSLPTRLPGPWSRTAPSASPASVRPSGIPIRAKSSPPSFAGQRPRHATSGWFGTIWLGIRGVPARRRCSGGRSRGPARGATAGRSWLPEEGGHESAARKSRSAARSMASRPARLKAATSRLRFADWWIVGSRASGLNMRCRAASGQGFMKTLTVDYLIDGCPRKTARTDRELMLLSPDTEPPTADLHRGDDGRFWIEARAAGRIELKMASGKTAAVEIGPLPGPIDVAGPWELRFPKECGAPPRVVLDRLISWSEHPRPWGVRYFSGVATYHKSLELPANWFRAGRRTYLDLGRVEVIAKVKLNGRDLGILWKPPFRVDVSGPLRAGPNALEIEVVNLWANR